MYSSAIVVAAGRGERLKSRISKPLIKLNSKPVIIYSLEVLSRHPGINEIIVVASADNINEISRQVKKYRIKKISNIILGGRKRQESVYKGLARVNLRSDIVLVHDAARPFIKAEFISKSLNQARVTGASVIGVPVKATIKHVTRYAVKRTLDRSNLWEIQTPQVFRKEIILKAYNKFKNLVVTDDAALVERLGKKVSLAMGSYTNIKITTPDDLIFAKALLKEKK